MKFSITWLFVFVLSFAFLVGSATVRAKKPKASIMGMEKGQMEKLTFIAAREIFIENNTDSLWKITSYEFDFSCEGQMSMKAFSGAAIPKEVIEGVKNCKKNSVADFRYIMAKNVRTGKEVRLNDITLTVVN